MQSAQMVLRPMFLAMPGMHFAAKVSTSTTSRPMTN